MSELSGFRRETTKRAYQDKSQTWEEISRLLGYLGKKDCVGGNTTQIY
jgi:hypothetical protein